MNKLNSIALSFWRYKERLVFAILLGVLCVHVYGLLPQEQESTEAGFAMPKKTVAEGLVEDMPAPPTPRKLGDWKIVYTPNPFWYLSSTQTSASNRSDSLEDADISLLRIQKTGDSYRAQLKHSSSRKWYREGEEFVSYKLLKIDPNAETCDVYSERLGRTITLKVTK